MNTKMLKKLLGATILSFGLITASYAGQTDFTVNATVAGADNIYCPQSAGSGGNPNPTSCGTVNFGTFTGTQAQQTLVATVTTNDPSKDATLTVQDSITPGSSYALKNGSSTIPLAIQYTDCSGNNYGSTSNSTPIVSADITGSTINGASPTCTSYNTYPASGTHGTFTFTLPTMTTLPPAGNYSEILEVDIGSV